MNHDEFICRSCGRLIYSFPPQVPPPTECGFCAWLEEFIADPEHRATLRRRFLDCDDLAHQSKDCETSKPGAAG